MAARTFSSFAQDPSAAASVFSAGDIAASGFAGATLQTDKIKPGVDPVTKTVIDTDGVTLRIYSGASLEGAMAGQEVVPSTIEFKARDVGHVFGLAFTRPSSDTVQPALYAAASSAFGLHIVGPDKDADGKPDRLLKGAPGAAFAEGLFGAGGGPGTIWKVDQATGKLSRFADVVTNGTKNSGPGLGAIALDPTGKTLYVSDLDTGLVHRFSTTGDPADIGQFDHGATARVASGRQAVADDGRRLDVTSPSFDTTDAKTWGFTQRERRVDALSVHQGRLFYSVADGPEIWSVGLDSAGAFQADARLEVKITSDTGFPITSIAFDGSGRMLVAERGTQRNPANYSGFVATGPARVLRFAPADPATASKSALWTPADEYAVGNTQDHRDANGGVAVQHGYNPDGTINLSVCSGVLVSSASALGPKRDVHGLQINPIDAVRAEGGLRDYVFINLEPDLDDATARGYAGGVAVLQNCDGGTGLPPVAGNPGSGTALPPVAGGGGFTFPPVTDDSGLDDPNGGGGGKAVLTVSKTAAVDKCSPKGGCAFNIEVRNDTAAVIAGPIVLNEQIGAPQAALTGEPNAPWACSKTAPFSCAHPGPVPAGGKLDMRVVFAPNTPPETKSVTNCVSIEGAVDAVPPATQCATIALDPNAPVQSGPVIVSKKAAGACTAKGPCPFTITLQNTLDSNTGEFLLNEVIDAPQATLVGEPNAPWTCTKTTPFTCKHPGLPAKSTTELQLSFAPNTPPEKTTLKNCAVPTTFTGGKIAPGKKTDLFDFRRGFKSLVEPAAFRPQSFARDSGLLHLVGGGNIGGVTNKCLEWRTNRNGFVVKQSNGFEVSFSDMVIENKRIVGGNATYMTTNGPKGGKILGGNVFDRATDGTFAGAMAFRVRWNDGTEGSYTIWLDDQGRVTGDAVDANKNSAKLNGDPKWFKCARNEICDSYAKSAAETSAGFNKLSCGPDDPPGRWSNDVNSHLNWCMAQPPSSTFLNSETVARTDGLAKCKADRAALCEGYVADALVLAKEFEARKCTEPHAGYLSTDPAVQQKFCLEESRGNLDSTKQSRKILLDSCIARLANAGGAQPGGAPPAEAGGAGPGGVAAVEPAPEQCAVVPIDPADGANPGDAAPGDVVQGEPADQGNGLTIQKQATGTACSKTKSCDFAITVTGAAGTPGPITVVDTIDAIATHDLKTDALLSTTPAAPWTCAKGHPLSCTHPGPIPAGGLVLNLGMKPGANATATSMRNCAVIDAAPQTAVPPPTASDTNGTKFEVIPPASCTPGASCAWQLKVTNTSAQPRTGSMIWSAALATVGGAAPVPASKVTVGPVTATPSATCLPRDNNPDRQVDCTVGEVTLAPNASYTATMNLQADRAAGPLQASMNGSFTTAEGQLTGRATAAASPNPPAVEEVAPEPSCATIPVTPVTAEPAQPPAPPEPNGLVLTKRRAADKCSDIGGGCAFIVRITNSSQNAFNGPLEFTDVIKTADGKALPDATLESQPLLTLAEGVEAAFSCTKAGETITCGTGGANAKIPPGKFVDAKLTMKPGPAGGATAIRNCAVLKSGGDDSCSNMALVNGPLLRLTKFGGGDTCLPRCTFAVVVQNVGNADASGAFKFKDTFTPVTSLGGYTVQPGTGECTRGGDDFFCVPSVNVLKPGELTSVVITVFGTAKAPEYKNCVDFVPQPQAPADKLVLDFANDGRCVTMKDTSPQTPNLVIRKQAPNRGAGSDGHCDLKSACRFTITVTNTGLAPFNGALRVTDTVSLGVPQFIAIGPGSPQSLPWTCSKVQNGVGAPIAQSSISCELAPLPNGLAPGTTATLEVSVTPGATWKGSDRLKNCVEITSDGDIGANAQKQDCAEVVLDPFNVKVAKTGDQSCPPGSNCTFKITLFNPGPIPHNAPVTITDALSPSVSAQIISINPPLPCATQPTAIPFSCTSPGPVRLDLDAPAGSEFGPRDFTMVVKMPTDGSAESYRNCIAVSGSSGAAGEQACHTVATKPAEAQSAPPVTEPDGCSNGMVLTNGSCACPPNTRWKGGQCVGTGGINATPQPSDAVATPESVPATATCLGGMIMTDGACACPPSMRWDKTKCVGTGGTNTTAPNGDDKDDVRPPPARPAEKPSISCPKNSELRRGECVCVRGFESVRGRCRQIKETPSPAPQRQKCPPDRPVGEFPRCCPENARFAGGQCRCLPGLQFRRGQCVAAQQPPPRPQQDTCPQGQIFLNGQCRRLTIPTPPKPAPSQQKCPGGYTGTPPNCQPPKVVYPPCPAGWSGTPGNCRPPATKPTPAPAPQPQRCDNGFSGFKPNCTCSGRKEVVDGQCIPKIQ